MSSISRDDPYHKRLRARIQEFNEIEASRNSPEMILDSPTRRGHLVSGSTAYSELSASLQSPLVKQNFLISVSFP